MLINSGLFCEGVVALAEVLAESHHICGLDLRQNPVRLGGLMALNQVLRINRSLASLQVDAFPEQQVGGAVACLLLELTELTILARLTAMFIN